jgi:hypothetical protein
MSGAVVTYAAARSQAEHERATHAAIAERLAALHAFRFAGEYDTSAHYDGPLYFVPSDTLLAADAHALGIRTESDLFGGVVPFAYVATKAIVHPLVALDAACPAGWLHVFPQRVRDFVLPGLSAFSPLDVRRAALELLEQGPVRVKPGVGIGGRDQHVIRDEGELEPVLAALDPAELERYGAAIEIDLVDATTYSIGRVFAAGTELAYCGTQGMTTDNSGMGAFGGSDLVVTRGGFDALSRLALPPPLRLAVAQARAVDAATREFRGFLASRRNYDAVRGRDRDGRWRCGVLEQSWRIGGASGAEVAAFEAFRADPGLSIVRARCTEAYGVIDAPPGAIVHYSGVDPVVGALVKYSVVEPYEATG